MNERIIVSSDHAGFELKEAVKGFLEELGYGVDDVGTNSTKPVDYPIYTYKAAEKVSCGEYRRGIIFCGTGQGDAIAANKVPGIRAALCWDALTARLSRSHNDSNVLVLGGWTMDKQLAEEIIKLWLDTPFDGGRHQRRLEQIKDIETFSRLQRGKVYDISLPLYPGIPVWPGDPPVSVDSIKSIAGGDSSNVSLLHIGSHSATHVDAPRHFIDKAPGIDGINPETLMGPARVFQLPDVGSIDRQTLEGLNLENVSRLLLGTRNSALLKKEPLNLEDYVYITEDAAVYLVAAGIKLLGIDYLSIEEYKNEGHHPVHRILLGAGIAVLEGIDLTNIAAGDYELICLPLNLRDGDAAPARVFLREV
jgi:arylformamidase